MKFLMINSDLLEDTSISACGKLIISYIRYIESYGKKAWGSCSYISGVIGVSEEEAEAEIKKLSYRGIVLIEANVIRVQVKASKEKVWITEEAFKAQEESNEEKGLGSTMDLAQAMENYKNNALQKGHTVEDSDGERLFMRDEKGNRYIVLKSNMKGNF